MALVARGVRITPAYAGKTDALREEVRALKDHPRLRGENEEIGGN